MPNILGNSNEFGNIERYKVFRGIVIFIALVFVAKLAQLQLIEGSGYRAGSEAQAIKAVRKEPFRGNMFDRHGKLILHNEPSFSVNILPTYFMKESIPLLASILNVDTTFIQQTIKSYQGFSPFIPIKILRDVDFNIIAGIEELADFLPGVSISVDSKRLYDFDGNMAHLLGYTREISKEDIKKMSYYQPGDIIGKNGLEKEYEAFLRGREGIEYVAVNKFGQQVPSFITSGKSQIPSNNGFDLNLAIDKDLQLLAEKALEGKRGAVVAIDPRNGEVLIYAVKPDYDPREFSGRISPQYYRSVADDESNPLLNRGVSAAYPPGSSWKMLVAIAALNEGIISEKSNFTCGGGYNYGGRFFKCMHNHGVVNVVTAIQGSCNSFFYQVALKLGLDNMIKYGKLFGFGAKTNIDISFENSGNYPDVERLKKMYKGYIPHGLLLNYGIGQGEILVTPVQMAQYVAAIANKGKINKPHVVRSYYNNLLKKQGTFDYKSSYIKINPAVFDIVHEGMYRVVNVAGGTATHCQVPGVAVCGKTSTAQNPHGKDHGWFVCFAPRENPTIAIAIIVENMGFGGVVAAPIAKDLLTAFFSPDSLKSKINFIKNPIKKDSLKVKTDSNKAITSR